MRSIAFREKNGRDQWEWKRARCKDHFYQLHVENPHLITKDSFRSMLFDAIQWKQTDVVRWLFSYDVGMRKRCFFDLLVPSLNEEELGIVLKAVAEQWQEDVVDRIVKLPNFKKVCREDIEEANKNDWLENRKIQTGGHPRRPFVLEEFGDPAKMEIVPLSWKDRAVDRISDSWIKIKSYLWGSS